MLRSFVRPAGSVPRVRVRGEPAEPEPADLSAVAAASAVIAPTDPAVAAWYANYRVRQLRRLAFDLGLVRGAAPHPAARLLDLGASPPVLAGAAAALGYQVTAMDIAPERFGEAWGALGVTPLTCDLEREPLPVPGESMDVVVLHEVFEHLRVDPLAALRSAAAALVPGGVLLLSTPSLLSLAGTWNLLLRGRAQAVGTGPFLEYGKLATLGHMGHVREYTTVEVCELLPRFGLVPEQLVFRGRSRGLRGPLTRLLPPLRPFFEVVARKGSA